MKEINQEREADALATVCTARARILGKDATDDDVLAEMRSQRHGDAASRAISIFWQGDDARDANDAWVAFCAAYERYCRLVLSVSPHAKTAKVEMMPEPTETSADAPAPDLRSQEAKHRAAVNAWDAWADRLKAMSIGDASAIWTAFHGWADLHICQDLTPSGKRFVTALDKLKAGR